MWPMVHSLKLAINAKRRELLFPETGWPFDRRRWCERAVQDSPSIREAEVRTLLLLKNPATDMRSTEEVRYYSIRAKASILPCQLKP